MDAEKRDIDISKLFAWKGEFDLLDSNDIPLGKIYMRLAGDADINRARVFALRESAKLRKSLHDPDSDEYLALLVDKELVDKEHLVMVTAALRMREITKEAVEKINLPLPIEPKSDASLEIQERFQKEVDEYPAKRMDTINKFITKRIEEEQDILSGMSFDELYEFYLKTATDYLCEERMYDKYREMCVYLGVYKNPEMTEKLFSSFEEFDNSRSIIKTQLLKFYDELEVDMATLKKL